MNENMQKLLVSMLEEGVQNGCFPGGVAAVGKGDELLAELNAIEGVVKTRIVIEN